MIDAGSNTFGMIRTIIIGLILMYFFSATTHAHRILFETVERPPAATIKAYFSRTSPLADAAVTVLAPGSDQPWQTGRTDKAGHFTFLPDQAGDWVIRVDDERGHVGSTTVHITEDFLHLSRHPAADNNREAHQVGSAVVREADNGDLKETAKSIEKNSQHGDEAFPHTEKALTGKNIDREIPLTYRIILGLAIIFGIAGFLYGWKARQNLKNANSAH
jgi:tetrahydromethanopterin S-methyltransferase subunit G